jgi:hypothetical protein
MGLFYSVGNSCFGQPVLQMVDPIYVSCPQFFEEGYVIVQYHRFKNFS